MHTNLSFLALLRACSFTLKDNDVEDQIVTKIYKDEAYGTPIFVTEGGATSCWHEDGTE